jgi:putative transposase
MSFEYRLTPTERQREQFTRQAGACRFVYNWGLARWKELVEQGQKPTAYGLMKELVRLKKESDYHWLKDCESQSMNWALRDLGDAFQRFFNKQNNYPQFKKKNQTSPSFCLPQGIFADQLVRKLRLATFGWVRYRMSRRIRGTPKSITISQRAGHWYASILCEIPEPQPIVISVAAIGVDVGIAKLATLWDGKQASVIQHNPNMEKAHKRLAALQKQLSHKQKGSKNRNKARLKVAKQHKRISDMRKDTLHKLTTDLCKNHAVIGVEDLKILNMMKSAAGSVQNPGRRVGAKRGLNRNIGRQGWGELFRQLIYKCKWYGSRLVICEAAYTSQTCPACGFVAKENRKTQALFKCIDCGFSHNADIVGAMNIRNQIPGIC